MWCSVLPIDLMRPVIVGVGRSLYLTPKAPTVQGSPFLVHVKPTIHLGSCYGEPAVLVVEAWVIVSMRWYQNLHTYIHGASLSSVMQCTVDCSSNLCKYKTVAIHCCHVFCTLHLLICRICMHPPVGYICYIIGYIDANVAT